MSCAVGLAVLDVIEEEGLQAHARNLGDTLLADWKRLGEGIAEVGNVRGSGLFLGMELVEGKENLRPNGRLAKQVVNALRGDGILLSTDGPAGNVIKFKPPMCFDTANAEMLTRLLEKTLHKNT